MRAMILAAGRGERMRPLTDSAPKPLLEAGGKPLIAWTIEALVRSGFADIVINHAHLGEKIEAALGDGASYGASIRYSPEGTALETAGGIRKALPLLGEHFLVVNGDVHTDINFRRLARQPHGTRLAHIVLVPNPAHNPQGDFALEDGELRNRGQSTLTFSGIGVYRADMFRSLTPGEPAKLAPLLRNAADAGRASGEIHTGVWQDIGTPQRLAELDRMLRAA